MKKNTMVKNKGGWCGESGMPVNMSAKHPSRGRCGLYRHERMAYCKPVLAAIVLLIVLLPASLWARGSWSQVTASATWAARSEHSFVVYDGKMWILKGLDSQSEDYEDIWYSTNGTSWTTVSKDALFNICSNFPTVVFKGEMYTVGGSTC